MAEIQDTLSHLKTRLTKMRDARKNFETQRKLNQDQVDAKSFEDWNKFYPNTKLEQGILEMRLGSRAWDIIIDVEPDQFEPNLWDAEIAKHILYKFMHEEQFHKELRQWRHDKYVSWTWILWTGITHDIKCTIEREKIKIKPQIGNGFFDQTWKKKVYKENWMFMPKNIDIFSFFIDDNAVNQPNFSQAIDCFMLEFGEKKDMINRRENIPWVDKEALNRLENKTEMDPKYWIQTLDGQVVFYHYFNRLTRDWIIMWNESEIILKSSYEYTCEWLPFVLCQHHPRNNCIYWMGDPEVIDALKAVKNATWEWIIEGIRMGSWKLILSWNSWSFTDSTDTLTRVYSWEVTIKDVTNSVEQYKEIDTNVNINPSLTLLQLIEDEVRIATWVDVKSAFEVKELNLWQTEIKEENKAIRSKSIDELEDFAIWEALTTALNNLVKFAPSLKSLTKEVSYNWKITQVTSKYMISLPNITIKEKDWKKYVEEDLWQFWEIEFTEDFIKGKVAVRVITSSTSNAKLTVIEKNKVKEMVEMISVLANIYWAEAVTSFFPLDFVKWKAMTAYGYWDKDTMVKSKKQLTKDENLKKLEALKQMEILLWQLWDGIQPMEEQGAWEPQWAAWEIQQGAWGGQQATSMSTWAMSKAIGWLWNVQTVLWWSNDIKGVYDQ